MSLPRSSQDLPGFWESIRAARAAQLEHRRAAYHATPERVAGVMVRPLTVRDCDALEGLRNPFVSGGLLTEAAAAQVLWVCSVGFVPGSGRWALYQRNRMLRRLAKAGITGPALIGVVQSWVSREFSEFGDPGNGPPRFPIASIAVSIVTRIQTLGLPLLDDQILDMPVRLVAQKRNVLANAKDPTFRGHDAADEIRRAYLDQWNAMPDEEKHPDVRGKVERMAAPTREQIDAARRGRRTA
jgi:hypothetical protein